MRTFQAPVSDCGCFVVGEIGPDTFVSPDGAAYPKHGLIVWYETEEACRAAAVAACEAHFDEDEQLDLLRSPSANGTMTAPTAAQSETEA